jgi:FkbM family methyltransferase
MNKLLCNICCAFIIKKKNRHHFRKKYFRKKYNIFDTIIEINNKMKKDIMDKIDIVNKNHEYSDNLQYYGQYVPNIRLDKIIYQRYFKDKIIENGVVLECGAFDGIEMSNALFFEESLGWTSYNIEPTPKLYEKLVKNRPNGKNFNFALSEKRGQLEFVINHGGLNGALQEADKNIHTRKGLEDAKFETTIVPCITYKEFIETNNIKYINLFSLDVERHERSVIKGMKDCSVLPDIFVLETNDKSGKEYLDLLVELGYIYDFQYRYNCFYIKRSITEKYGFKLIINS